MDKWKDPLFWTTIVATLVNVALYQINKKTFRLLHEKPKIVIQKISLFPREQDGIGGLSKDSYIKLDVLNPSSLQSLIISRELRQFPFGTILDRGDANIQLPVFGRSPMHMSLDYVKVKMCDKKLVLLTLLDIKGRKIRKVFRLRNTELT